MTDSIAFCTESIAAWSCTIEITVILFAATARAIVSRARWGYGMGEGGAQVVDGDVEQLGGVGAGEDLVLEAHGHQVVQLRAPTRSRQQRQRERAAGARTLFMLEVLRRMMEEWASLSKICRAEAELYSSCGLNSSAMKSGVNIARTTSWRTAHSDRWTPAVG